MSFESPIYLVLLVLPLLFIVAYLGKASQRDKYSLRWTNVDAIEHALLPSQALFRHLGTFIYTAALVILIIAAAGPVTLSTEELSSTRVVIILDVSTSMAATDISPTRLQSAIAAIDQYIATVGPEVEIGLVTFAATATPIATPTYNVAQISAGLKDIKTSAGTATGSAVYLGVKMLQTAQGPVSGTGQERPSPGALIILSDGSSNSGRLTEPAIAAASKANIPISTISYGTSSGVLNQGDKIISVPSSATHLNKYSQGTGGKSFAAGSDTKLAQVFNNLTKATSTQQVPTTFSPILILIALILLLIVGVLRVVWYNNLP